jgi:checkpoint serine/threonine-protein kinase
MTFHSKAATNDVYDLFNQPLKCEAPKDDTQSGGESDFDDDGYSTAGESTGTGMISGVVSESGNEDTSVSVRTTMTGDENTASGVAEIGSEWTEFSASKHVPPHKLTKLQDSVDTNASRGIDSTSPSMAVEHAHSEEELKTPIEPEVQMVETKTNTCFVPVPPQDYDPTPLRAYRDPSDIAQSRLPFMTPIVEKTESSLAANTGYQKAERDYFTSKTPSRSSSTNNESPSKIGVENLLLNSPLAENVSPLRSGSRVRSAKKFEIPVSPSPKSKRASRGVLEEQDELSSPRKKLQVTKVQDSPTRTKAKVKTPPTSAIPVSHETDFIKPTLPTPSPSAATKKSPVITDLQCNPTDTCIRNQILANAKPPLLSYYGFFDHPEQSFGKYTQLQKYAKKVQESKVRSSPRKPSDKTSTQAVPPILSFTGASRVYAVKRELGQGAFAPVYLVESYDPDRPVDDTNSNQAASVDSSSSTTQPRSSLEAIKAESPPSQAIWEFHIIRHIHSRLSQSTTFRSLESIITAHECHAFADEAYLILDYAPTGTLLDLINLVKADNKRAGKPVDGAGLDEILAMFYSVELLRTVEALHRIGILHGDLKGDNCLVRLPLPSSSSADLGPYSPTGANNWSAIGLTLIDFGRGIDLTNFSPRVGFIADWAAGPTDAPEIREARPWLWQIDLWGAAGVVCSCLFGRYLDAVPVNNNTTSEIGGLGAKKKYKLKEGLKRYWQADIWAAVFDVLLNPNLPSSTAEGEGLEAWLQELGRAREVVERFLEEEGERRGLRRALARVENLVGRGRRR